MKEETWSRGTNSRLTLVNMMLNISDVHTSLDSFRDENHT